MYNVKKSETGAIKTYPDIFRNGGEGGGITGE